MRAQQTLLERRRKKGKAAAPPGDQCLWDVSWGRAWAAAVGRELPAQPEHWPEPQLSHGGSQHCEGITAAPGATSRLWQKHVTSRKPSPVCALYRDELGSRVLWGFSPDFPHVVPVRLPPPHPLFPRLSGGGQLARPGCAVATGHATRPTAPGRPRLGGPVSPPVLVEGRCRDGAGPAGPALSGRGRLSGPDNTGLPPRPAPLSPPAPLASPCSHKTLRSEVLQHLGLAAECSQNRTLHSNPWDGTDWQRNREKTQVQALNFNGVRLKEEPREKRQKSPRIWSQRCWHYVPWLEEEIANLEQKLVLVQEN